MLKNAHTYYNSTSSVYCWWSHTLFRLIYEVEKTSDARERLNNIRKGHFMSIDETIAKYFRLTGMY